MEIFFKKETIFDKLTEVLESNQFRYYFDKYENPVRRNRSFSLKQLARTKIYKSGISYDGISTLIIPNELSYFLKKQKFYTDATTDTSPSNRVRFEIIFKCDHTPEWPVD